MCGTRIDETADAYYGGPLSRSSKEDFSPLAEGYIARSTAAPPSYMARKLKKLQAGSLRAFPACLASVQLAVLARGFCKPSFM